MGTPFQGRITQYGNPFTVSAGPDSPLSQFLDGGDTLQYLLQGGGLPPVAAPTQQEDSGAVLRAVNPDEIYNPLQRIGNVGLGALSALVRGVLPVNEIPLPGTRHGSAYTLEDLYRHDPIARGTATAVQVPTAVISGIVGALTTGGAYNAAAGGIRANAQNREAVDTAVKAGNFAIAKQIESANVPATVLGAGYGFAGARLPGALGGGAVKQALTGAAMGYPQDIADQALEQYAATGRVDMSRIDYRPGFNTLLGGAIPAGIHFGANATARNTAYDALRAGVSRAASTVRQRGRVAHGGFMRVGGPHDEPGQLHLDLGQAPPAPPPETPLQGDYRRGTTERQYAGAATGETVPRISTSAMQADADAAVQQAVADGNPQVLQGWISHFESQGDALRANAIRQAAIDPDTITKLPADMAAQISREHEAAASDAGRLLQSYQNNPLYRQQREFVSAGVENLSKRKVKVVEDGAADLEELVDDSFGQLFTVILDTFKLFVEMPRAPKKVKATGSRNGKLSKKGRIAEPKVETPGEPKALRLRRKTVRESEVEARQLEQRRKRLEAALEKESRKAAPRGERVRQLKLGLGQVERRERQIKMLLARALAKDPTQPRAPRPQRTINLTPEQQKVQEFARERLRAKNFIRRKLESANGERKPIVRRPYQFTAAERELLERVEAQRKEAAELRKLLRVKKVKELTAEAAATRQQQKVRAALDAETARQRKSALSAITRLERVVNKQLQLPLNVKRSMQALTQEAMNTLSPEELAYFYDLVERRNRAKLHAALDRRLALSHARGDTPRESLRELYERLAPNMTPQERARYEQAVNTVERRKFLDRLTRRGSVRVKRKLLDRLMDAQGHDLLNASTPEVFGTLIGDVKAAMAMNTEDWRKLNAYAKAAADPMLAPKDRIRANALIEKLIADQKNEPLLRKWLTFRAMGMLFQSGTQAKNYLDQTISWAGFRLGSGLRELGSFAYSRVYGNEYGIEGGGNRGLILRTSQATKDFYTQHELGVKDELQNMGYDLRAGTNTTRARGGDINASAQPRRTILHTRLQGPVGDALRAADHWGGGIFRAVLSGSERVAFADAYRVQLSHDIEVHYRVTGEMPDVKSETYKLMRENAVRTAEQVTLTNRGAVATVTHGIQRGLTEGGDYVGRRFFGLKPGQSYGAGELAIPFATVPANAWLRPLELVPVAGALGIGGNRAVVAKDGYFNSHQVFGEVFASQMTGLALTAGAAGQGMMYAAGYYGAVNIRDQERVLAAEQNAQAAGRGRGTINSTAFGRYWASGNPQDFIAQENDVVFNMAGIGAMFAPLAYLTAPGRRDAKDGREFTARTNEHTFTDVAAGAASALFQNDSFRGLNRLPDIIANTRNPDTGELDPGLGAAMAATDFTGFRIPGSDLVEQPIREPRTVPEMFLNRIPFADQAVPARTTPEGIPMTKHGAIGMVSRVAGAESYAGYMNILRHETGKTGHLFGSLPRRVTVTSADGTPTTALLSKQERTDAGNALKVDYATWVERARQEPTFAELGVEQQVSVLARIKNDIIRAYLARPWTSPDGKSTRPAQRLLKARYSVDSGINLPNPADSGAYMLYTGEVDQYANFIRRYIRDAQKAQINAEGTILVNQALGDALP